MIEEAFEYEFAAKVFEKYRRLHTKPKLMSSEEYELMRRAFECGKDVWKAFIMDTEDDNDEFGNGRLLESLFPGEKEAIMEYIRNGNVDGRNVNIFMLSRFHARTFLMETKMYGEYPSSSQMDKFLDDTYLTVEHDMECYEYWLSIRGAEDVDASNPELQAKRAKKYSMREYENIPGLGNIKHLLKAVEKHAVKSNNLASINRLKTLLKELRPKATSASKWASEERLGQAELYEACEKVLEKLKNYKEHSLPFLQKVNKRDAPDYYDVIKNPMDLGTMAKKLKACQYNSKSDFASDLQLIWSNCLYYNSDEASIYRVHAKAMNAKSLELLKLVPEIKIRAKDEVDNETGYESADTMQNGDTMSVQEDSRMEDIPEEDSPPPGADEPIEDSTQNPETAEPLVVADVDKEMVPDSPNSEISIEEALKRLSLIPSSQEDELITVSNMLAKNLRNIHDECLLEQTWELRAEYLYSRITAVDNLLRNNEGAEVLMRSPEDMGMYHYQLQLYKQRRAGNRINIKNNGPIDESFEDLYFWPENNCVGCFPNLFSLADPNLPFPEQKSLQDYISAYPTDKSIQRYKRCVDCLRECKRLERKLTNETVEEDEEELQVILPMGKVYKTIPILNEDTAQNLLKRSLAIISLQQGFDACNQSALQLFTDCVAHYLYNVGKIAATYQTFFGNEMDAAELILHTLYESGVHDLSLLDYSIKVEPERQLRKLERIRRRMMDYYDLLLKNDRGDFNGEDEDEGDLNEDPAFMMGDFGHDLGVDFLGLKSMGLDIPPVPDKLWNVEGRKSAIQKKRRKLLEIDGEDVVKNNNELEYEPPQPFPVIKSHSNIIKLAQQFFEKKLAETSAGFLVEDEFLPNKSGFKKKKKSKVKGKKIAVKKGRPKGSLGKKANLDSTPVAAIAMEDVVTTDNN